MVDGMSKNSFIVYISGGCGDAVGVMRPSQSQRPSHLGAEQSRGEAEPVRGRAIQGEAEPVGSRAI